MPFWFRNEGEGFLKASFIRSNSVKCLFEVDKPPFKDIPLNNFDLLNLKYKISKESFL